MGFAISMFENAKYSLAGWLDHDSDINSKWPNPPMIYTQYRSLPNPNPKKGKILNPTTKYSVSTVLIGSNR